MADLTGTPGTGTPRDDAWDLLPAYALDAVDDLERRAVERLLAADPDARRALDEYRDVVAAFTVESVPPPALREQVLGRVAGTPQQPQHPQHDVAPAGGEPAPDARPGVVVPLRPRRRWALVAAAAAAVVAVAVPTTVAVRTAQERDALQAQAAVVDRMMADPDAAILRAPVTGGGTATVLVAGDDMYFRATDLPDLGAGQDYQLWVVAADGSVRSAGVLADEDGTASSLVQDESGGVGMAVTVEPSGGSEQPTSDPVVVLGA